jgi:hypothetical protein
MYAWCMGWGRTGAIPGRDSLIFTVHLWNPAGAEPGTMAEVLNRYKDVQYSSRIASQITQHQQAHRLRTSSTSSQRDCRTSSAIGRRCAN